MLRLLVKRSAFRVDRVGRVMVNDDLTIPGHPEVEVIGDLANFSHQLESRYPAFHRSPCSKAATPPETFSG